MAVFGAPSYFERRLRPHAPHDLTAHTCISLRLPTSGGLYAWPFAKDGRALKVRAEGQLVFNSVTLILNMALAGLGLAYLPEDLVDVLLPEPPATHAGLRPLGRGATPPGLIATSWAGD